MAGVKKSLQASLKAAADAAKKTSKKATSQPAPKITKYPSEVGFTRDVHRPMSGGPGWTGSKALAVIPKNAKAAKGKMSGKKKGAITAGVLLGLSGIGAFGQKGPSTSSSSTSSKSAPDTAMSNRYAKMAEVYGKKSSSSGSTKSSGSAGSSSSNRPAGLSASGRSYTAAKGDSLWSIAEKTVPKGTSVSSWWLAIKKMNTKDGKLRRLYTGTGVSLPPGARRS